MSRALCLAFGAAAMCLSAAPLAAQDQIPGTAQPLVPESEIAIATRIVDVGFPEATREAMFFGTVDQMTKQMRDAMLNASPVTDEGALAILDQWLLDYVTNSKTLLRSHIPSLMEALARSYAVMFTQRELEDILAFVSTDSGQRFFQLSSAVIAEPNFAQANQAYMNAVTEALPAAQEDLKNRLIEYYQSRDEQETTGKS